jgi:hypothetical protein
MGILSRIRARASQINHWELAIDKFVDFILIFVGLYAAISVQRWQDEKREKKEYVNLLEDLRGELDRNQKQRDLIEKSVGPIASKDPGKVLGNLEASFTEFRHEIGEMERYVGCVDHSFTLGKKKQLSADEQKKLAACKPILLEAEREIDRIGDQRFVPLSLGPVYQEAVWQLYLANGMKVFENKDLAARIGIAYTDKKIIESSVSEIERVFNDSFMQQLADINASLAELDDLVPDPDAVDERVVHAKVQELHKSYRSHRLSVTKIHSLLEMKVARLKDLLSDMDSEIEAIKKLLDEELKRQKR